MALKGRPNDGIGSHAGAVAVSDITTGIAKPYDIASTFSADKSDIPKGDGAKIFKFPLDDVSAGNFWTRCIINSWVPAPPSKEVVKGQSHRLDKDSLANIWLPMPLTLGVTYRQKYTETDNMMVNRGSTTASEGGGLGGFGSTFWDQAKAVAGGMASESTEFVAGIANVNNSGKMAMGSISNQQMGLVYDGASLRNHTLAWRMVPKDREEQNAIETICFAFKKFSSPVVKGPLGGDTNHTNSAKAHKGSVAEIDDASKNGVKFVPSAAVGGKAGQDLQDSMRSIGRLGIPVTVNVEFWYGAKRNPHLFQIKDSFIESVEINYTPSGTWNAYEDGAPIETNLTIVLKENAIVTADDIKMVGGY